MAEKLIKVVLRDERDTELKVLEVALQTILDAGVIEHEGEFFTYRSQAGQFFATPVFRRVNKVTI